MQLGIGVGLGFGAGNVSGAGAPVGGALHSDDFNRADGALSTPYTITAGGWNVASNQLVLTATAGIDRALVTAAANVTVQAKFVTATSNMRLIYRNSDTSNEWIFGVINGSMFYRFGKRVANAVSIVQSSGIAVAAGDTVKVVVSGNTHQGYVNGVLVATVASDAHNSTATRCGLGGDSAASNGATYDDLLITSP